MKVCRTILEFLYEWRDGISIPVFSIAAAINILLITFAGFWTVTAGEVFNGVLDFITSTFGAYYILITAAILLFVVWILFSRYGNIRMGKSGDTPQFSLGAWLAMLFAAGMGLGLVFWGVAEPLYHFHDPPMAASGSREAAREAVRFSYFHWGFHPWAIYAAFALGIALLHFRHNLPLAPRSLLFPLFGNRIDGWLGHLTDAFCTVGTLLGVATSLGLGAMQINAGLSNLTGVDFDVSVQIWIILVITIIATMSTVTGVSRGIKVLSITNVMLMLLILCFVFFAGPTHYQLRIFVTGLLDYMGNFVQMSTWLDLREDNDWQAKWTLFYWGWWLSWSPFVGIFVARISRGRTIREFVLFVMLLPSLFNFFWFAVFGGSALYMDRKSAGEFSAPVIDNVAISLHHLLAQLPWSGLTQWLGLALVIIFFITSSDSGSFVDDMVTSGGNPDPPVANRIFWGFSEGAAAAVLLVAGGLSALQAASISAGLPQSLLLVFACIGIIKILRTEMLRPDD